MFDPDALPPPQILALLSLHEEPIAAVLVQEMTASGFASPSPEDICALALVGCVTLRGDKVHLTSLGRQTADELILEFSPHSSAAMMGRAGVLP